MKEINRNTLQGLWALARLHLDHNRLEFIHPDAFQGLTSLRLLQLEGNQLQQLHPATFTTFTLMGHFHFSTLRHLYLSDNRLTSLPSALVETMQQLENLYLHGNPWICDCNMRWLHDWDKTSPGQTVHFKFNVQHNISESCLLNYFNNQVWNKSSSFSLITCLIGQKVTDYFSLVFDLYC